MLQLAKSFNKFVIVSILLVFATAGSYATVILDGFGNATTVTGVIVGAPRMMSVLVLALSTKSSGSPPPRCPCPHLWETSRARNPQLTQFVPG
jgi:uncharacterized membrane protein